MDEDLLYLKREQIQSILFQLSLITAMMNMKAMHQEISFVLRQVLAPV